VRFSLLHGNCAYLKILFCCFNLLIAPKLIQRERLWLYIKEFLAWQLFDNLDELRIKVKQILNDLTNKVIGYLTGWSWILQALCASHLY
jgi:hypothetical protein